MTDPLIKYIRLLNIVPEGKGHHHLADKIVDETVCSGGCKTEGRQPR